MGGRRKTLIVASDEYQHEGLRRLLSPAADAEALAGVLGDPQIGDFDVDVVRNEPAHDIKVHIEDLFSEGRSDDVLLLHFSCHGLKSESGELFFAACNTRPNRLASTAVSADFVQRCMRASRSRSIVLFLDCCYGGAFGQGVAVRASGDVNVLDSFPRTGLGGGRGRAVITASNSMEYAFEGDRLGDDHSQRPSVFTTALVEGLATGDADRDEDGWVSLNELYSYVYNRVCELNPNQTPSRDIEMQGELYLARSRRRRIRALPVPPDLQAAMTDANMFTRLGAVTELRTRLLGDNLSAAAGAYEALTEMASTDIQYVAEAAREALGGAALQVAAPVLRFGQAEKDSPPPHRTVHLLGPPLARACTFTASHRWIRVDETSEGLDVSVTTADTGELAGEITIKGPTGEATVLVEVEVTARPEAQPASPMPLATEKPPSPSAVAPTPVTAASQADVDQRAARQVRADILLRRAGQVGIVGAALLLLSLTAPYLRHGGQPEEMLIAYVLFMAALAVVTSGLTLTPRTRQLVGPGLLLGAVAASTAGLVLLIAYWTTAGAQGLEDGLWLPLAAHLVLVFAAWLAWRGLTLASGVRLARRPQPGVLPWLVVSAGVVGALALFGHGLNVIRWTEHNWMVAPYLWMPLVALVVPTCAALAAPRRFGVWLLAGWIGGGVAFLLVQFFLLWAVFWHISENPVVIIFGLTLPALLVLAVLLARRPPAGATEA